MQETEDLKQHLQASKQRKLTLTAEVRYGSLSIHNIYGVYKIYHIFSNKSQLGIWKYRFLRRRLKYLMKTPLQIAAPEIPVQSHNMTHLKEPMQAKKRKYKEKAPVVEKPREVIDLNKVSLPVILSYLMPFSEWVRVTSYLQEHIFTIDIICRKMRMLETSRFHGSL